MQLRNVVIAWSRVKLFWKKGFLGILGQLHYLNQFGLGREVILVGKEGLSISLTGGRRLKSFKRTGDRRTSLRTLGRLPSFGRIVGRRTLSARTGTFFVVLVPWASTHSLWATTRLTEEEGAISCSSRRFLFSRRRNRRREGIEDLERLKGDLVKRDEECY